ncbi:hypothetical protein MMC08_003948 [Hypocenomyce scalaris]|nr:hypothetical protein [Hypocenomyce scalaris]
MAKDHEETLAALSNLQNQELSIIRLSEPISATHAPITAKRSSDVSTDAFENPSPASLDADLGHYKELFSKLRFSYLEQVTKEKFLRAIVGDPPLIVEHQENVELEAQLAEVKAELKAQKAEVAGMVEELERTGRELSRRYENIKIETAKLCVLPTQISTLQTKLAQLQQAQQPTSTPTNPSLTLPLPATLSLLSTRTSELDALNAQLRQLQAALPRKTRELERLENELRPLEVQKAGTVQGAREARRMREEGGGEAGQMELRGRWLRGCVGLLGKGGIVGVEG